MTTTAPTGSNKILIALISIGALLLVAVVAIVFLLIGQNTGNGSVNASDQAPVPNPGQTSATPVAGPTTEAAGQDTGAGNGSGQAPADNSLRFTSFNAVQQVQCDETGQSDEKAQPQISWASANAVKVYWTPSNQDATADNGYQVGASGNQNDMSASKGAGERYEFPCNHRETFDTTITIYGANGQKVSKHVTFTDVNWNSGDDDSQD